MLLGGTSLKVPCVWDMEGMFDMVILLTCNDSRMDGVAELCLTKLKV